MVQAPSGQPVTWQGAVQRLNERLDELDAVTARKLALIEELARSALSAQWQTRLTNEIMGAKPAAGVLIMRHQDGSVHAQHISVHYTPLMNAADGILAMRNGDYAFVDATAAGVVLDALGVQG